MGCYKEMTQYEEQWTCKKSAHIHHGEKEMGGNKNETRRRFQSSASKQQHQSLQVFIMLFYIVFYAQAANDIAGIDVTWMVLLEKTEWSQRCVQTFVGKRLEVKNRNRKRMIQTFIDSVKSFQSTNDHDSLLNSVQICCMFLWTKVLDCVFIFRLNRHGDKTSLIFNAAIISQLIG